MGLPRNFFLPLLAVGSLGLMGYHVSRTHVSRPQLAPPAPPPRSPFADVVAGSGLVEARTENIHVASPLPGTVAEVPVKVGERVRAGQLLFRLDDRQMRAELAVRQAQRESAAASLARLEQMPRAEEIAPSEARVGRAAAELKAQEDLLARRSKLFANKTISEEELIQSRQAVAAAREALAQAEAEDHLLKAGAWERDLVVARAEVAKTETAIGQIQTELQRLEVCAPVDGDVLKVDVRPGEFVGTPPGQPLVVLGDLSRLHVRVEIDEQDIPRFRPGMPGKAVVRGGDGKPIPLEFVRVEPYVEPKIALTGDPGERVDTRVLQAIYAMAPSTQGCYVGQQIDVFLEVAPAAQDSSSQPAAPRPAATTADAGEAALR
ncbi:MAG: HlyD family efflux transporter periplasmic adaptor subunit [Pirellulales bacterium]|nr:HlyD family efflux transporter periplasmic adaptor subunit [Pirellulales bacterium]